MARATLQRRLSWQQARVVELCDETPRVRTIVLEIPDWPGHRPGQHVDVRLTAEDGYQAQRSYSIATPPDGTRLAITVERLADGEVSPYLAGELRPGDLLELRGPIGGYFVWEPAGDEPAFFVGGGSGVVPLMAMVRARGLAQSGPAVRLLVSARTLEDVIYSREIASLAVPGSGIEAYTTLTRSRPDRWTGYARRVDEAMLEELAWAPGERPMNFVCGPTGFVETVASALVRLGHPAESIRTERFGPTGS